MARRLSMFAALVCFCLLVSRFVFSDQVSGQTPPAERPREVRPPFAAAPGPVISGAEIGVRLRGDPDARKGTVAGNLVVKINGQWVDVVAPSGGVVVPAVR